MNRSVARSYPPVLVWTLLLQCVPLSAVLCILSPYLKEHVSPALAVAMSTTIVSVYLCGVTKRWYLLPAFLFSVVSTTMVLALCGY
jgi:hypothetical protein